MQDGEEIAFGLHVRTPDFATPQVSAIATKNSGLYDICQWVLHHLAPKKHTITYQGAMESTQYSKYVKSLVLTIPVHFTDIQRRELISKIERLKLNVDGLVSEPIATALRLGQEIGESVENYTALMFEFGGNSCSAAVVRFQRGAPTLREYVNEKFEPFEEILIPWVATAFRSKHGLEISVLDFRKVLLDTGKVGFNMEEDSTNASTGTVVYDPCGPYDRKFWFIWSASEYRAVKNEQAIKIDKQQCDTLIKPLMDVCRKVVESALRGVGLKNVHYAVLTHAPIHKPLFHAIMKMLKDIFGMERIKYWGCGDEPAKGAAAYANYLRSGAIQKLQPPPDGTLLNSLGMRRISTGNQDPKKGKTNSLMPIASQECPQFSFKDEEGNVEFYKCENGAETADQMDLLRELFEVGFTGQKVDQSQGQFIDNLLNQRSGELQEELMIGLHSHVPKETYRHQIYHMSDLYGIWFLKRRLWLRIRERIRKHYSSLSQCLDVNWREFFECVQNVKESLPNSLIEKEIRNKTIDSKIENQTIKQWQSDLENFGKQWLNLKDTFFRWQGLQRKLQTKAMALEDKIRIQLDSFRLLAKKESTIDTLRTACLYLESRIEGLSHPSLAREVIQLHPEETTLKGKTEKRELENKQTCLSIQDDYQKLQKMLQTVEIKTRELLELCQDLREAVFSVKAQQSINIKIKDLDKSYRAAFGDSNREALAALDHTQPDLSTSSGISLGHSDPNSSATAFFQTSLNTQVPMTNRTLSPSSEMEL
eukprot:Gregarina_sp_Poly_1__3424@NODE_1995_length_2904_cov_98_909059_g1288_i0_p1_GENE_NODE_1995_length_2904_cov_98_909059_g1288_i0NODE_1995_length_2904_cov_98_909059_g1288_i0_p1_ORF_typecomplete_len763_score107_11HSP70/PF00012_20/3_2e16HSP70/PF00012_20/5_7e02MreB_Mbl/PF06723_13/1_9e05MreB_Mbl/PF06723_13/3_9e03MreB_Mbl/PF06723_13/4_6e03MreB_Mbl/PF06723_13/3e03Endotoxin_N/PF03945_14/0_0021CLAG/PF03805_13/2_1e03CLAG/PF03805_13/4_1e03CLAG/PF03805_13/0_011DUF812/PF05667_11/0_52ADIP/PF11559_8/1e02ADIP/PF1155